MSGSDAAGMALSRDQGGATRLLMYHKQDISARTRFLRLAGPSVCAFGGRPRLAQVLDAQEVVSHNVIHHPGPLLNCAEQALGIGSGGLRLESDFTALVDIPGRIFTIYLARFTSIDPSFEAVERLDCRFVELTAARDLPPAELELLRRAYVHVMEG